MTSGPSATAPLRLVEQARQCVAKGETVALVKVIEVRGSAPREEGAAMLVTGNGIAGSIGGGTLEWQALAQAQKLLSRGPGQYRSHYALGPDLGQCCGGNVQVQTWVFDSSTITALQETALPARHIYLFGAGHVGRALVLVLAQTEFRVHWVDARPGAFPAAVPANVTLHARDDADALLSQAPTGSIVVIMSHSHALDLAVAAAALRHPGIAETGLIGSATKRARFERRLAELAVPPDRIQRLICPIGVGEIRSKRPEAIAISAAAQLLALDERLKACESQDTEQKADKVS